MEFFYFVRPTKKLVVMKIKYHLCSANKQFLNENQIQRDSLVHL